jgi:hypothetical protein
MQSDTQQEISTRNYNPFEGVPFLELGAHWIASEEAEVKATLRRVIKEGKSRMNSSHLLGKFDHFTDDDWDNALLIWWQCLAVFFFFGGAISAAVWA